MELATLITETVKLSDEAHRANNAGHPLEAQVHLSNMYIVLCDNASVFKANVEPETEPAPEPPAQQPASDGD